MDDKQLESFLISAIRRARSAHGLDNQLAMMSAINGLIGFLEGGLEAVKEVQETVKV